jgi:hypothetical protein
MAYHVILAVLITVIIVQLNILDTAYADELARSGRILRE